MKAVTKNVVRIGGVGAVMLGVLGFLRLRDEWRVRKAFKAHKLKADRKRHSDRDLTGLPTTVQRLLRHGITPGATIPSLVRLKMMGKIRGMGLLPWLHFSATEELVPGRAYTWKAQVRFGPIPCRVIEYWIEGRSGLHAWIYGLIPIISDRTAYREAINRRRLALSTMWAPSGLLPSETTRWTVQDDRNLTATMVIGGQDMNIGFVLNAEAGLQEVRVTDGASERAKGPSVSMRGMVETESRFGDFTIPTDVTFRSDGGGQKRRDHMKVHVTEATFE